MRDTFRIGCVVFIKKDNTILLGKRKNVFGAGTWGLPGGHLDKGEKIIDAAKRELKEELSIKSPQLTLSTITDDIERDPQYIHFGFTLENFDGEFMNNEPDRCEEWRFFPLDNLPEIFPWHISIIEAFKKKVFYLY